LVLYSKPQAASTSNDSRKRGAVVDMNETASSVAMSATGKARTPTATASRRVGGMRSGACGRLCSGCAQRGSRMRIGKVSHHLCPRRVHTEDLVTDLQQRPMRQ
jgi:hypothetical protein